MFSNHAIRAIVTFRPCVECHRLTQRTRCRACQQAYERRRGTRQQRGYDAAWQQLRARALREQPWCSIANCPNLDLTADHIVPLSRGGLSVAENVQVLCAFHQTSKGAR